MEQDTRSGTITDILSSSIHLSLPLSNISCYQNVKFLDLINEKTKLLSYTGKRICIFKFKTEKITSVLEYIIRKFGAKECKQVNTSLHIENGSRYVKEIEESLQCRSVLEEDVINSTARGANFLITKLFDQLFVYKDKKIRTFLTKTDKLFPYLLLLINEQITFIKVTNDETYEKIYEASFNCGHLLKLANCLFEIKTMEELFEMINRTFNWDKNQNRFADGDTLRTENNHVIHLGAIYDLLKILTDNLFDHISLQCQYHNFNNIIVGEYCTNEIFLEFLNRSYERSEMNAELYFMRYPSISTSLGILLKDISNLDFNNSWLENYALSTGLTIGKHNDDINGIVSTTVLDRLDLPVVTFPLLKNPTTYQPSYDDSDDIDLRKRWLLGCIENVQVTIQKRITKDPNGKHNSRFMKFANMCSTKLTSLIENPTSYGKLTFIMIQDIVQQYKKHVGLFNSSYMVKTLETEAALNYLGDLFKHFDTLLTADRHVEIAKSLLAGNLFDWGIKETNQLFGSNILDFRKALSVLPDRPWAVDNLDLWLKRMTMAPHKFAAIFPDNCGFDFILGVLPFTRELIKRGTKVMLCANAEPVINDVTTFELKNIMEEVCHICPILGHAYKTNKLFIMELSRSSPCLDFRCISKEIAELSLDLDLIMIDGMGRTIMTNFMEDFRVECLKVAVIKDHWLSRKIGGIEFAPIFRYTNALGQKN